MNNVYNSIVVEPNTPTIVNSIFVPLRGGYSFKGLIIWCEVDCLIEIKLNVATIGGGRISGANQTLVLDYAASPYGIGPGDIIIILATQNEEEAYPIYSTLLVEQL